MHAIDGMACAKRGCDNRGKLGLNIVGHGSCPTKWGRRWRYRCTVCGGTGSTHTGTAYSGLRCARREFDQVASLRVEGVSMSATARVTGHARHTIARWLERASTAAKRFNQRMLRDFEIIELQADELCTFIGTKPGFPFCPPDQGLYTPTRLSARQISSAHVILLPTEAALDVEPTRAPAFRPFLRHRSTLMALSSPEFSSQRSPAILPALAAPRSSAACRRTAAWSDDLPPGGARRSQ